MVQGIYFDQETRSFSVIESTEVYSYEDAAGNVWSSDGKLLAKAGEAEDFLKGAKKGEIAKYKPGTGGRGPQTKYTAPSKEQAAAFKKSAKAVSNKSTAAKFRTEAKAGKKDFMKSDKYRNLKDQLKMKDGMRKLHQAQGHKAGMMKGAAIGAAGVAGAAALGYGAHKLIQKRKEKKAAAKAE